MSKVRILPQPTPGHVVPLCCYRALYTVSAVLDVRQVLAHWVAMAEISVLDALLSRGLTTEIVLLIPALSIAGLFVLLNDLALSADNVTPLQPGAVLVRGNTTETFLEVPVIIGDGDVTTVTVVVMLNTYLSTPVLRPRWTLLKTPVTGDPQHCRGLSNTTQYLYVFLQGLVQLGGVDVVTLGR